jgi:hypothetical protein
MGKSILANIPPPTCEKSGLELSLAQVAGPLGNLAARQTDQQQASLSGKRGKRYLSERELRSCWDSRGKGSKKELPALFTDYTSPNLNCPGDNPAKFCFSSAYLEAIITIYSAFILFYRWSHNS